MIDIVKSRTIHKQFYARVGTKADAEYDKRVKVPCRERVTRLLAEHSGQLHGDVGDLFTAHFDHTQDAVTFTLALQRLMSSDPIAVPEGCKCPHVQLHIAIGRGSMEGAAYQKPGTASVGAFNELARILAITGDDQTLVTVDAKESSGQVEGVTWHAWDVILPKEEDRVRVFEMLWDGRGERRPTDMNPAISLVEAKAGAGDPLAREAIEQARRSEDPSKLQEVLSAERDRLEAKVRAYASDWVEANRELATVAFIRGDIDVAAEALQKVLALSKDDLDANNRLGHIFRTRGDLAAAERQFRSVLSIAKDDDIWRAMSLGNLGLIAQDRGDLDAAEKRHIEALEIDRKLGRLEGQARHLGNLGLIAGARGDLDAAEKLYRESLELNRKFGRLEGQAIQLGNLGLIARARGDFDAAETLHREALAIDRKLGRLKGQASELGNLGVIARKRGDLDAAEKLHREALEIDCKLGRLEGQANHLAHLGVIAELRQDLVGARGLWTESRDLFAKVGMPHRVKQVQALLDGLPGE
jgi:Tfp pilus assembly protein PilF